MTISYFEELKTSVKDKWLDYYETNRDWLDGLEVWENNIPNSSLILGVVAALEPKIKDFLIPFKELNKYPDQLIKVLELGFDPEKELEIRAKQRKEKTAEEAGEYLNKFREEKKI
jgi:hypothetical protein